MAQIKESMGVGMNKLVSIILPVYNGQKYIESLLASLYFQTYRPIKLIISDDGSKDESNKIIMNWTESISDRDFIIKYIRKEQNEGLSANINSAAKYIEGDYIFLADQDDLWKKDKVKKQVEYLEANQDCFVCLCDRSIIDEDNKLLCKSEATYKHIRYRKMDYSQVLCKPSIYAANCMVFRNEHLEKIFPIPRKICEHDTFIMLMVMHYGNLGFISEPLIEYRIHSNNLSQSFFVETSNSILRCFKGYVKHLKRMDSVCKIDSYLIKRYLKDRFHENLSERNNQILDRKTAYIYMEALKKTLHALSEGKLNQFYK